MPRIVELPLQYRVVGVPVGMRKPRTTVVSEIASFEIGDDAMSTHATTLMDGDVPFHGGRPWFLVPGADGRLLETPADVLAAASVAVEHPRPRTLSFTLTSYPDSFRNTATHGRWIIPTDDHDVLVVPHGRSWKEMFRSIEWSDRDGVVATMNEVAGSLRFVDGVLRTDRFEVFASVDHQFDEDPALEIYLHDAISGSRYFPTKSVFGPLAVQDGVGFADWYVPYRGQPGFVDQDHRTSEAAVLASSMVGDFQEIVGFMPHSLPALAAFAELRTVEEVVGRGPCPEYSMDRLVANVRTIAEEARRLDPADRPPKHARTMEELMSEVADKVERLEAFLVRAAPIASEDLDAISGLVP